MLPSGVIMLWVGSIASIPSGFVLCDGNNGTPDLRGKFLIGAGGAYSVGDTGGSATHTHAFTTDGHNHTYAFGDGFTSGTDIEETVTTEVDTGTTDPGNNLPPYHALAYIMKT